MQTDHEIMDRHDEEQIIREMKGEILSSYIYSFTQAGRQVTGLSYAGVKQAIRKRGQYAIYPCDCCHKPAHVEETNEGEIRALVKVWDLQNNVQFIGASTAKKTVPFAYVLAINKAERNAFRKLLPEKELALIVEEYKRQQTGNPLRSQ